MLKNHIEPKIESFEIIPLPKDYVSLLPFKAFSFLTNSITKLPHLIYFEALENLVRLRNAPANVVSHSGKGEHVLCAKERRPIAGVERKMISP